MGKKMNDNEALQDLLTLWFAPETEPLWFESTPEFDQLLRERYEALYLSACEGKLDQYTETDDGALAVVILLDQVPLNIYRNDSRRYATATRAIDVSRKVIDRGGDLAMDEKQKTFLYLPYMHSESLPDQEQCIKLFERAGMSNNLGYARHHRDIVARFGRFPHRNIHLGRESTAEELAWLESDDAFVG